MAVVATILGLDGQNSAGFSNSHPFIYLLEKMNLIFVKGAGLIQP